MKTLINNYINGNLTEARKQARRYRETAIWRELVQRRGFTDKAARLAAHWLKTGEGWQAACDAA